MHHLVPQFILKKEEDGQTTGQFDAPALFIDVSGFSAITDVLMQHGQHGSEVLARVMRAVFTPLVDSVYGYGGFITTYAGDAFTAVFPLNNPHHAITAAWQMILHMQTHDTQSTEYGDFVFTIRIGLATGNVQWGIVHSQDQEQAASYFKGSAIQGCIAAEGQAQSGQLILHESIYQASEQVVTEPLSGFYRVLDVPAPWPDPMTIAPRNVDLAIATRFFPQMLFQQTQSGEFRQVLCAFVNLQGEPSHDELEEALRLCFALQKIYGGLMSRLDFSDKGCYLLLFWGAPKSYEQDLIHALGFMLDFRRHVHLPLRAGLTYGIAHAGFMGAALREEYTLYGRGINLAARFMVASAWQEIWVDEQIANRLETSFQFDYLDERLFKGFATPQPVYQLVRKETDDSAFYQGSMVGREQEMTELQICVVDVLNGRFAGLVNIVGEPGIGKSRLIYEFLENTAVLDRCQVFLCQTDEIVRRPFNPFRYFMLTYFNQSVEQDEAKNKEQFELTLNILKEDLAEIDDSADLIAELDRTIPFLGALIDLYWPDSLYEELEPQLRFENSISALKTLFKAESLIQPIIIVLEDTHWLDDASYTFVEQLTRNIDDYPIFLIATSRPEETSQPLTISSGETTTIHLEALGPETLAAIAYDLLGSEISRALADYLAARADGNPFFAEQIVLDLQERELLVKEAGGWSLLKAEAESLPTDVRAVLLARLDRLTQEVKDVVHTASVLGREFELRHLLEMLRDDQLLEDKVAHAEQVAIWSVLRELRYIFKHALLRDAAYRMQLRARRQELHGLVVKVLESLYAQDLRPYYPELAHHAQQADQRIKARDYFFLAGELAQKNYQNNLAQAYFTQALSLTQSDKKETQFDIILAREESYFWLGDREKQDLDLQQAEELCNKMQNKLNLLEVTIRKVRYLEEIGSFHEEIAIAQEGLDIARDIGDLYLIARILKHLGIALYWLGEYDAAKKNLLETLAIAIPQNYLQLQSDANYHLAEIATKEGGYLLAESLLDTTLAIDQKLGNRQKIAATQNFLGVLAGQNLNYITARKYLDNALLIQREIGNRSGESKSLNNLGAIAHIFGDYSQAQNYYQNVLSISREIGGLQDEAIALSNKGEVLTKMQLFGQAKNVFNESLKISRAVGFRYGEAYTLTKLGETYLSLKKYQKADACFKNSVKIYMKLKLPNSLFAPRLGRVEAAFALGNRDKIQLLEDIDQILEFIDQNSLDGLNDPFYYFWQCIQLLMDLDDPRSRQILELAFNQLIEQADRILDSDSKHLFLNFIPEHKSIIDAYNFNAD